MKITKELQAKINRTFEEKSAAIRKAYTDSVVSEDDVYKLSVQNDLEAISASAPSLMDLLTKYVKSNVYRCNEPPTLEQIATYMCGRVSSPERKELLDKRDAALLALARGKEDFLIQISYAEDLSTLKGIFENFGLAW